jgi:hypothetical protein
MLAFAGFLEYNASGRDQGMSSVRNLQSGGRAVLPRVTDVERVKEEVRKMAAGRVLAGDAADVCLDLARMDGCRVCIAAGYGKLSETPQLISRDRLLWILDGYAEIVDTSGRATHVSQGESMILAGGTAYRLVFSQLTIYLRAETEGTG